MLFRSYGVKSNCVDPRKDFIPSGTPTAADGGTAGSKNYFNLRDLIIKPSELHLYEFLHIANLGQIGAPGLRTLDFADVDACARMIERNRDTIVGVKVQMPGVRSPFFDDWQELLRRTVVGHGLHIDQHPERQRQASHHDIRGVATASQPAPISIRTGVG